MYQDTQSTDVRGLFVIAKNCCIEWIDKLWDFHRMKYFMMMTVSKFEQLIHTNEPKEVKERNKSHKISYTLIALT